MVTEAVSGDIAAGMHRALMQNKQNHYATIISPAEAGALLRAIDGYRGHPYVVAALTLAPVVFVLRENWGLPNGRRSI